MSDNGKGGQRDLKCTIIVRAYGDPETTDKCLQSLGIVEVEGAHVILIDQEGAWSAWFEESYRRYEAEGRRRWRRSMTVVRTPENVGAVRATNQGLQVAMLDNSQFVLVLDNDVEIPDGDKTWLDRWLAHFDDENVAAVGAVTDRVSGAQNVQVVDRRYTRDWQSEGKQGVSGSIEVPWLISFACMYRKDALIQMPSPNVTMGDIMQKRSVHISHHAHLWDERFSPGQWEDIDVSIRLTAPWCADSTWKLVVAQDVYLHHKCHSAFEEIGGFNELLETNIRKGCEKWTPQLVANIGQAAVEVTR